jgi:transcriptional regulator with XRE-family HTH domain
VKSGEIRRLRQGLRLTIDEFATKLRVKSASVSAWEEGDTAPNHLCCEALARLDRAATEGASEAITAVQLEQFDRLGAVSVDSPFSDVQIESSAEALDRHLPFVQPEDDSETRWSFAVYRVAKFDDYVDTELLTLLQHPFLEQVASRVLRSDSVEFFTSAILKTYPQQDADFDFWEHVDIRYHTADLEAVPRRMLCSLWIWLSDVEENRGPLMYRPGSQRLIAAHMEAHPSQLDKSGVDELPDLDYAASVPLLARAGQVSVFTTSTIHGASINTGQNPRRAMVVNFIPKGLEMRPTWSTAQSLDGRDRYHRKLKELFRPDRRRILHGAVGNTPGDHDHPERLRGARQGK